MYQIELAMKNQIREMYGDNVVYSPADEEEVEPLKEMNLSGKEVAFEVKNELKQATGADIMALTVVNGEYDEESGWIKEKFNLGILRPDDSGETKYKITNFDVLTDMHNLSKFWEAYSLENSE